MISHASLRVGASSTVRENRSYGSLAFRPAGDSIWMVGAAASPIGGDVQFIRVAVEPGGTARLRSVSATVARRGTAGAPSTTMVAVKVGSGATLAWEPEPGIAAEGSDHITDCRIRLAADARLYWSDEWILGRHGEGPGAWRSRTRVVVGGRPLVVSDLATGPGAAGWAGAAGLDSARAVSSLVVYDRSLGSGDAAPVTQGDGSVKGLAVPLALPGGWQVMAWGSEVGGCRELVRRMSPRRT